MLRAIERGLTLRDFEHLTLGMILGYVVTYNNEHFDDNESVASSTKEDTVRQATQADFDRF